MWGHLQCMHARLHRRKDQLPLRLLPAKSLLLFDLAQQDGNISDPKGPLGTRGNGGISEGQKHCYLKLLGF